jgi:hypothetical protein
MNKDKLKKLYESNIGDIIVKTKRSDMHLISHILTIISPFFNKKINIENIKIY